MCLCDVQREGFQLLLEGLGDWSSAKVQDENIRVGTRRDKPVQEISRFPLHALL